MICLQGGGNIDVRDTNSFVSITQFYPLNGTTSPARELIVDNSGQYLLTAYDSQLLVYKAESLQACLLELQQANDQIQSLNSQIQQLNTQIQQLNAKIALKDGQIADLNSQIQQKDDQINQLSVLVDSLNAQLKDTDTGKVLDSTDRCPNTPTGNAVDPVGCSITEFCSGFTSKNLCNSADWNNDEPLGANDCVWQSSSASCRVR